MRLFREPLLHFALLGGLIFIAWGVARKGHDGPLRAGAQGVSRSITITAQDLEARRAEFRAAWKREPGAGELGELVQTIVDEEILYREALAQGLDQDDKLVRRRLVEKMIALARPPAPGEASRDELRRWYQLVPHRFRQPATTTFDALFFDPKRRTDAGADATRALASLAAAQPGDAAPAGAGDPFILSTATTDKTELELVHLLGDSFARAVAAAPVGRWQGPVTSTYGVHLVRVTRRAPERLPPFDEIETRVRADWLTVQMRGQRAAAGALLPRYDVTLSPELQRDLAAVPALAPYLARAPKP